MCIQNQFRPICKSPSEFALMTMFCALVASSACVAQSNAATTVTAPKVVAPPSLIAFANQQGYLACSRELDELDKNLFANSEYSLRPFVADKEPGKFPFSAIVDARRATGGGGYTRTLTHLTVLPSANSKSCTAMYEQTQYHDVRCDAVHRQMAPNATESPGVALGAITLDLHRNMTLTLIPVGQSQCVSVLKEVSYR